MLNQRYLITGGSGFIGSELIKSLMLDGHTVTILTRNEATTRQHFADLFKWAVNNPKALNAVETVSNLNQIPHDQSFDVVVNLAGQGIADKRWTDDIKKQLLDSRVNTTRDLFNFLKDVTVKPDVFISGSAIGYYGIQSKQSIVDENAGTDHSFSSKLCQQWEAEAQKIEALGIRTCYLRTGIVLGKNGGALAKMLPPFKLGLGGPIGNGKQWMPWIHMDDMVGIIRYLVDTESLSGPFNATAPNPVTNKQFSKTLGKVLKRPALFPMPAFMVKILFGQMGEELLLSGLNVVPAKLQQADYHFKYSRLEEALKTIV